MCMLDKDRLAPAWLTEELPEHLGHCKRALNEVGHSPKPGNNPVNTGLSDSTSSSAEVQGCSGGGWRHCGCSGQRQAEFFLSTVGSML